VTELILRLGHHDERVLLALVARRRRWLDTAMRWVTHVGGASSTMGLALLLLASGNPALVDAGARGAFALVASHLLVQLLKRSVHRPRPRLDIGTGWLVPAPDRFSFPSGHAASALSVAAPLAALLPLPLSLLAIGMALVVGLSRAYLGVHYPGDVLAGWILALVGLLAAAPTLAALGLS
jgi:undecaprenyl-diphosphatase